MGPESPLPSFLAYRRISFSKSFLDSMQTYSSTMSKAKGSEPTNQPTNQVKHPTSTEYMDLYKDTNFMGLCKKKMKGNTTADCSCVAFIKTTT